MSAQEVVGRVVSVRAYPVKSMDAGPLARAQVLTSGVEHDRSWAVVDEQGQVVNARTADVLRTVRAAVTSEGPVLTFPGDDAAVGGEQAAATLTQLLGRPVRVQAAAGAAAGFNEVAAMHVVSRQAVARGTDHDGHGQECPCSVEEPRANLVLDLAGGAGAELETAWVGSQLRVGEAVLRITKAPRHCLGVYAEVVREGEVAEGDEAVLTRG